MNLPSCPASSAIDRSHAKTFPSTSEIPPLWSLSKLCTGVGALSLAFQVFAADPPPAPAGSTTVAPTTAPPPGAATPPPGAKVDWSKVPPVTAPPRPGMFTMPPSGPNYYTLKDQVTGKKRDAPPVSPFAPYALMTTPAFDLDFRYMEKPGYEPDLFDPIKRIHLGAVSYTHLTLPTILRV